MPAQERTSPPAKKTRRARVKVRVDVALDADLSGYGSARAPTEAHHRLTRYYSSPLLLGPPRSDDLLALVMHIYTEEEADVAQHLRPLRPRTAAQLAGPCGRGADEVARVLDHLSYKKNVLLSWGAAEERKYAIMPVVPGTFEAALMTNGPATFNSWHRTFAEIFERIFDTGFLLDYNLGLQPAVRYLPVGAVAKSLTAAWPSDKLEQILEPHDLFAVGNCQCRAAMHLVGKGCNRPLENCLAIGPLSQLFIDKGSMRQVDRGEALAIKREAEESGLVSWMGNVRPGDEWGNISCSCCGCCCHGLRVISEFNAPGMISKPHFMPARNEDLCDACMLCVKACPMAAWAVSGERLIFQQVRCIGCGLCVVKCNRDALALETVASVRPPDDSWKEKLAKMTPVALAASSRVWLNRLLG